MQQHTHSPLKIMRWGCRCSNEVTEVAGSNKRGGDEENQTQLSEGPVGSQRCVFVYVGNRKCSQELCWFGRMESILKLTSTHSSRHSSFQDLMCLSWHFSLFVLCPSSKIILQPSTMQLLHKHTGCSLGPIEVWNMSWAYEDPVPQVWIGLDRVLFCRLR